MGDFHARAGFGWRVDDATSVGETRDKLIDFSIHIDIMLYNHDSMQFSYCCLPSAIVTKKGLRERTKATLSHCH